MCAATNGKSQCFNCGKEKITYECKGCSKEFCLSHLTEHHQFLNQEFDKIEYERDEFQEILIERQQNPNKYSVLQQINQWELNSIEKIKEKAEECRQSLNQYTNTFLNQIENKLNLLTKQLKEVRQENEFNEFDLNQFKIKLNKLQEELDQSPDIAIELNSLSFINKISVISSGEFHSFHRKWKQNGITIARGKGEKLNQLCEPCGICVVDDETIYIADCDNHRIIEWKSNTKDGRVIAGGNGKGSRLNQLNRPSHVILDKHKDFIFICDRQNRRVMRWSCKGDTIGEIIIQNINCLTITMDQNGDIYVSDTDKHEVTRWRIGETDGTIVAGGNGKGNNLNQLNFPSSIFVDRYYSVYVSDRNNHRIVKWMKNAKEGILIGGESNLTKSFLPLGLTVDQMGRVLVVDSSSYRVMLWSKEGKEGKTIVGGNGDGPKSNQFEHPVCLALDEHDNLYVSDVGNHRIQKFQIDFN